METTQLLLVAGSLVLGLSAGYVLRRSLAQRQTNSLEGKAKARLEEAEDRARKVIIGAESNAAEIFADIKREERERKTQLDSVEGRLVRREETLEKRESEVQAEAKTLKAKSEDLTHHEEELRRLRGEVQEKLETVSGLWPYLKGFYTRLGA